jgi:hypothetical protein
LISKASKDEPRYVIRNDNVRSFIARKIAPLTYRFEQTGKETAYKSKNITGEVEVEE